MQLDNHERSEQLKQVIIQRIQTRGAIPFEEFMELALYYPHLGYYTSPTIKLGPEGDYYTSAYVNSAFGICLARQLAEMWELSLQKDFVLVEFGAGEGLLALDILEQFKNNYQQKFCNLRYYICERSEFHCARQKQLLKNYQDKVFWVSRLGEINNGGQFVGCIFSNELLDAFAVHRVKQVGNSLKEIYVDFSADEFKELLGEPSKQELKDFFPFLEFKLQEGQEVEINLRTITWLKEVSAYLRQGFILTIDYGYQVVDLAHPLRFDGTIMCYREHRLCESPLTGIGLQDITCHVNFTALQEFGKDFGLQVTGYTNQMKFLVGLGIREILEQPGLSRTEKQKLSLAIKRLIMPGGMGERFQVLIQQKGFNQDFSLSGLKGFR